MDTNLQLIIGGIGLPVFAAAILWGLHKAGMPDVYDNIATFAISLVFAVLVLTMNFFPETSKVIVGAITMLYTLLTTLQKFVPDAGVLLFGTPEQKAKVVAKLSK